VERPRDQRLKSDRESEKLRLVTHGLRFSRSFGIEMDAENIIVKHNPKLWERKCGDFN